MLNTAPNELLSPKGSLFNNTAISLHLQELGYPENSIRSMLRCGNLTGFRILKVCSCKNEILNMSHRCNLRTCPVCSKTRQRRIVRKYAPFLRNLAKDRTYFIYFLTISPKNYSDLNYGLKHIRQSFIKFLRHKYIKERVKAGLYVIETKGGTGNWNIHLHALIYGRYLDNRIRGSCLDCGQNLIKHDHISKKYYCANRACNSQNLIIKQDSKIVSHFKEASGRSCVVNIQRQSSSLFSLNYMCKYISSNKDDFFSDKDTAIYINSTRKNRLITSFGLFYRVNVPKFPMVCVACGGIINFTSENILIEEIERKLEMIAPDPQRRLEQP